MKVFAGTTTSGASRTACATSRCSSAQSSERRRVQTLDSDLDVARQARLRPRRLQRAARRTARSPTTRASRRRCRRSSWSSSAGGKVDPRVAPRAAEGQAPSPKFSLEPGRRRASPSCSAATSRSRPTASATASKALVDALDRAAGRCCSRTCASTPRRRRTTRASPRARARSRDVYVNDAFGTAHRAHASTRGHGALVHGARGRLPHAARARGTLGSSLERPGAAVRRVLGGAKVSDKIEVIENLLERVRRASASAARWPTRSCSAQGKPVGSSRVEEDKLDLARETPRARARRRASTLLLPVDHLARRQARGAAPARRSSAPTPSRRPARASTSARRRATGLRGRDRRGADGVLERPDGPLRDRRLRRRARWRSPRRSPSSHGHAPSSAAATRSRRSRSAGSSTPMTHVSTGGGASLEFLEGASCRHRGARHEDTSMSRTPAPRRQLEDAQHAPRGARARRRALARSVGRDARGREVVVAPPFTALEAVARRRSTAATIGLARAERALGAEGRVHRRDLGADAGRGRLHATSSSATASAASSSARPTRPCSKRLAAALARRAHARSSASARRSPSARPARPCAVVERQVRGGARRALGADAARELRHRLRAGLGDRHRPDRDARRRRRRSTRASARQLGELGSADAADARAHPVRRQREARQHRRAHGPARHRRRARRRREPRCAERSLASSQFQ